MTYRRSTVSTRSSDSARVREPVWARRRGRGRALGRLAVAIVLVAAAIGTRLSRPRACAGGDDATIEDATTFDAHVLGRPQDVRLFYDPATRAIGGGPCQTCAVEEMRQDWSGYLGSLAKPEEWEAILLRAPLAALDAMIFSLQGKADKAQKPPALMPARWKTLSPEDRSRLVSALYFVGFARRVEPFSNADPGASSWGPPVAPSRQPAGVAEALLTKGGAALARTTDPFLRQRYAFQLLRLRFYSRPPADLVSFYAEQASALEGPSSALMWRARYYLAGAERKAGHLAEANLWLARIHASSAALASAAASDFQPVEDADWRGALRAAKSPQEKIWLWHLVGLRSDALVAWQEIERLDPHSEELGLLAVRELNRVEATGGQDARALEAAARKTASRGLVPQPWLFSLVAAHAAALRGDLAAVRRDLAKPMPPPGDDLGRLVAAQTKATLALALANALKKRDPKIEEELAATLAQIPDSFSRRGTLVERVLRALGTVFNQEKRCAQGAWLEVEACAKSWSDPAFLEAALGRAHEPPTGLDKLVMSSSRVTAASLETELGVLYTSRGELDKALAHLRGSPAASKRLGTEPFIMHIRDCHDCDHARYGPKATWSVLSLVERMSDLEARQKDPSKAGLTAEAAAREALLLGHAYYNLSYFGNARVFSDDVHAFASPAWLTQAAHWYKRAFDQAPARELKAEAAFMAAKAELGTLLGPGSEASENADLPIPAKWFPVVKKFRDTAYVRDVIRECGNFRIWLGTEP